MGPLPIGTVLVVVDDPLLQRAVERVVALAAARALVADASRAAQAWSGAAAVVVDEASAQRLGAVPRRSHVALVTTRVVDAEAWRSAVGVGADTVQRLPDEERALLDWLVLSSAPPPAARLICCVPARGGAGASTLAAALAVAAAASSRSLLLDLDPAAAGIDLLMGIEEVSGPRWPEFAEAAGALRPDSLGALPTAGGAAVLSCDAGGGPLRPPAVAAVLDLARRAYDVVVVDACRDAEPVAGAVAIVVVPSEVRAVRAATAHVASLSQRGVDVRLVVRTPGPGDLRPRHVADAVAAPVVAEWRWQRRFDAQVDAGRFLEAARRSPVTAVASRVLTAVLAA